MSETKNKRPSAGRVPASTVVNFCALLALFVAIFLLENVAQEFKSGRDVKTFKPASALIEEGGGVVFVGRTAVGMSVVELEEEPPPVPVTIDLEPKLPEVQERAPKEEVTAVPVKVVAKVHRGEDVEYPVEELDNEYSRRHYLAANSGSVSINTKDDFIPFEKR